MANRIKGITVEIGGDTTGLDKALKGVNNSIRTTQSSLRDVNRLLKLDPKNTTLLSQQQKLLKDSIGATKEKLEGLKAANPHIVDHRGIGLMQGLEFDGPAAGIVKAALEEGLVLISAGTNVIRFVPPLVISREDVDEMAEILSRVLARF